MPPEWDRSARVVDWGEAMNQSLRRTNSRSSTIARAVTEHFYRSAVPSLPLERHVILWFLCIFIVIASSECLYRFDTSQERHAIPRQRIKPSLLAIVT